MRFTQSWLIVGSLIAAVVLPNASWARPSSIDRLERRLEQVEQVLQNKVSDEVFEELERLRQEVNELRGSLEEQQHSLSLLNNRQETIYHDFHKTQSSLNSTDEAAINSRVVTDTNNKLSKTEQETYDLAYTLVEQKQFDDAIVKFQDFLWQHPDGKLAPNAHYWLGEIFLAKWQQEKTNSSLLEKAINSFSVVVSKYNSHHKAVDSMLKLGLIDVEREKYDTAKKYFTDLITKYPKSSRVRIAEGKLTKLKEDGKI